jgi:hypothetical protein
MGVNDFMEYGNDPEENERFRKGLSKCRTCDHVMIAHNNSNSCMDARLTNKEVYSRCICTQFIPKDNLEFLEWAAENKKKGKKHV